MARLTTHPLTPDRWDDVVSLFGQRGACGGCWCMWWRLTRSEWERRKGASNRRAFKRIVDAGREPGVIAYRDGEPVGWCAVEPREAYAVLARSRVLAPLDDRKAWAVTCFFVRKDCRGQGVTTALLEAAARHAKRGGAEVLEGYAVVPTKGRLPDAFIWSGVPDVFTRAGFVEAARPSRAKVVMRKELVGKR